jgi:hypothetical protein
MSSHETEEHWQAKGKQVVESVLNSAVRVNSDVARNHLRRVLRQHPDRTPAEALAALDRLFLSTVTASGGAVGAVAAAPGVGTGAALAVSTAEVAGFVEATALYSLSVAEIYGLPIQDVERRKTILFAVLIGESATNTINQVAGRTGAKWGAAVTKQIPMRTIRAINSVLGRNVVTKWGTKQGIIVLGRLIPFGIGAAIGAGGGALSGMVVVKAVHRAYGPPPGTFASHIRPPRKRAA